MTVLEELKKPSSLLSTVIAVLSILLSMYFYFSTLQKREPYYLLHPSSQIYSKAVSSPKITVVDSAGKPVDGEIHVLELSFWNNGKLSIEPTDVRTPVFIEFPAGYRLLDSKVVRESKPAVSAFKISEPQPSGASPRVQLQWLHLDPALGARLQFIYVGEANPKLSFKGDILDAEILDGSGLLKRVEPEWVGLAALIAILIVGMFLIESVEVRHRPNGSRWLGPVFSITKLLAIIALMALAFWLLFIPKSAPV